MNEKNELTINVEYFTKLLGELSDALVITPMLKFRIDHCLGYLSGYISFHSGSDSICKVFTLRENRGTRYAIKFPKKCPKGKQPPEDLTHE